MNLVQGAAILGTLALAVVVSRKRNLCVTVAHFCLPSLPPAPPPITYYPLPIAQGQQNSADARLKPTAKAPMKSMSSPQDASRGAGVYILLPYHHTTDLTRRKGKMKQKRQLTWDFANTSPKTKYCSTYVMYILLLDIIPVGDRRANRVRKERTILGTSWPIVDVFQPKYKKRRTPETSGMSPQLFAVKTRTHTERIKSYYYQSTRISNNGRAGMLFSPFPSWWSYCRHQNLDLLS